LLEAMHRAARANDRHDLALNDAAFHGAILAMSGNATLVRVWRALEPFSRTYITLLVPGVDPVEIADLHEPILDAIRRRDPELLDRVLRRHFVDAAAKLDRGWGRQPDAPAMAAARSGGGAATRD
jgi:DNA-binding GntR family transcriptional regulator